METVFVLLVLSAVAVMQTAAVLDLSNWKPTCQSDGTVTLPKNTLFNSISVDVSGLSPCQTKSITTLKAADFLIAADCIDSATNSVTLKIHRDGHIQNIQGGKGYEAFDVTITCSPSASGQRQSVTANVSIANPSLTPASIPGLIPLTLEVASGADAVTAAGAGPFYLSQPDVYLRVKHTGFDHYVLVPLSCTGTDGGPNHYKFFKVDTTTCVYENDVMEKFTVGLGANTDITHAQFYPFKFATADDVTLTCEILVCPGTTTAGTTDDCGKTLEKVQTCTAGSVDTTRRRRRSADGQEPHTRVLEVTYAVVNPDPALQGHTAAGSSAAVSVPLLLAAVVSRWIL